VVTVVVETNLMFAKCSCDDSDGSRRQYGCFVVVLKLFLLTLVVCNKHLIAWQIDSEASTSPATIFVFSYHPLFANTSTSFSKCYQ
jgi:hypothetical protein